MKIALRLVLIMLSVAYPLLWYIGRERGWFTAIALLMLGLWGVRAVVSPERGQKLIAALIALFFAATLLMRLPQGMYWYPVWVNALMFVLFAGSLLSRQSMIERFARLREAELPEKAVAYTRKVTQIWCVFFVANGAIAAFLVLNGQYRAWALYTGGIAYVLMGALLGGEYLYRRLVIRAAQYPDEHDFNE